MLFTEAKQKCNCDRYFSIKGNLTFCCASELEDVDTFFAPLVKSTLSIEIEKVAEEAHLRVELANLAPEEYRIPVGNNGVLV